MIQQTLKADQLRQPRPVQTELSARLQVAQIHTTYAAARTVSKLRLARH